MFERFTKDARAAVHAAVKDAQASGRPAVEAEHLFVALAASPELQAVGLDRGRIVEALVEEERQSLSAVGVSADHYQQPSTGARVAQPPFGASAKLALERGVKLAQAHGNRRFGSHELLGGVLAAEHGRVPRALELAGIDVDELKRHI
jgi:ATP-dependent Clp protease ATP-binding subunit ClpA